MRRPLVTHPHNRKDNPMNEPTAKTTAEWLGAEDQARLIAWYVGAWNDLGYPEPLPFAGAHPIPPLGQRSADDIKAGHSAIEAIDELIRDLHALRAQLVTELRADQDLRAQAVTTQEAAAGSTPVPGSLRRPARKDELVRMRRSHEEWEEAARACVCPPGPCTRDEFRDHAGESDGCMVCADLDPGQPCYTAVVRALCAQAGR
jgi:hypothetical protein